MSKTIVISALPYIYSTPHMGNFVGSVLPADVYYKYLKMSGEDAIFICGSDQHGTAIELAAIKRKMTPEQLADEMHEKIKKLFEQYECTFTYYGKTHSEQNKEITYQIFNALYKNGYIKEQEDLQAYCNNDNIFLVDRFIEGTCPYCHMDRARGDQCDNCGRLMDPTKIINPHCTICGKSEITFKKVKNLALELNKLQPKIKDFIEDRSKNDWTKNAINKPLSYIKEGLKPRDITRSIKWGFPVPLKGYEGSVLYVWFDALIGYIGITKEWNDSKWEKYWKDKDARLIHFMGKDNIEFHTLIWPATLIGSDLGFVLPSTIRASEFLLSKNIKFSKSLGVGLNLETGLGIMSPDYWRFVLMYLYPETADSEFSVEIVQEVVNTLMNDKVGNLVNRVLTIAKNNKESINTIEMDKENKKNVDAAIKKYKESFDKFELREALKQVIDLAGLGNSIMSAKEPWKIAKKIKEDKNAAKEFSEVLGTLIAITYYIGIMLWPFVPGGSEKVLDHFGIDGLPELDLLNKEIRLDWNVEPSPIFKKLGKEDIEKLKQFS